MNDSKAKGKILFIDSCYSGIGEGKLSNLPMSIDFEKSLFRDLSEGWAVFASCKHNENSFSLNDGSMSVFTYYLAEGLKGNADKDKNLKITLEPTFRTFIEYFLIFPS